MKNNLYTFKELIKDVFNVRGSGVKNKHGRSVWGTDPLDLGEGLAFSYSGDNLILPGKDPFINIESADIELELILINKAIDKFIKNNVLESKNNQPKNSSL